MALALKSTRSEYELFDQSGYSFKVIAEQVTDGPRKGAWSANVTFSTSGMNSEEAAVTGLRGAADHFLRLLNEVRD